MTMIREPRLTTVPIAELRPTQITVGLREVEEKRKRWREMGHKAKFLGTHLIPVVHGYKSRYYLTDHHHLALALHEEGVKVIGITVIADLTRLDKDAFWTYLDNRAWLHPFDQRGVRRHYKNLPTHISGLVDDPYRSLAGELRRAGGYAKDTTPFSEFLWADFMRRRIKAPRIRRNFVGALDQALQLAKSEEASYLPGWCGPFAAG